MTGFIALSLQDAAVDRLPLAVDKRFLFPTYAEQARIQDRQDNL
jgi:hypothetical protein